MQYIYCMWCTCNRQHEVYMNPIIISISSPLKFGIDPYCPMILVNNDNKAALQLSSSVNIHNHFFPSGEHPNNVYSLLSRTTNCQLYSNISQILLRYKILGYYNNFDSMKSFGYFTDIQKCHDAGVWSMDISVLYPKTYSTLGCLFSQVYLSVYFRLANIGESQAWASKASKLISRCLLDIHFAKYVVNKLIYNTSGGLYYWRQKITMHILG